MVLLVGQAGLDDHFAGKLRPPRPSGDLGDELEDVFSAARKSGMLKLPSALRTPTRVTEGSGALWRSSGCR